MRRLREICRTLFLHYFGPGKRWPFVITLALAIVISVAPWLLSWIPTGEQAASGADAAFRALKEAPAVYFARWTGCQYDWRMQCLDLDDFDRRIGTLATPVVGKDGCYLVTRYVSKPPEEPPPPPPPAPAAPARDRPPGSLADRLVSGGDIPDSDRLVTSPESRPGILVPDPRDPTRLLRLPPPRGGDLQAIDEERCYEPAIGPWGSSWQEAVRRDWHPQGLLALASWVLGVPDASVFTVTSLARQSLLAIPIVILALALVLLVGFWGEKTPPWRWHFLDFLGILVLIPILVAGVLWVFWLVYAGLTAVAGTTIAQKAWAPVAVVAANYKRSKKLVGWIFSWPNLRSKRDKAEMG